MSGTFTAINPIPSTFYPTLSEILFTGGAGAPFNLSGSLSSLLDDLVLAGGSPFKGAGASGTDIGADIAAVKAAIAGVVP